MRIGFCGIGALGKPVALAMNYKGHDVLCHDIKPERMQLTHPFQERGPTGGDDFQRILQHSSLRFGSLQEMVRFADLIFLAVQTPHQPQFEGITPLTDERADFDYSYLRLAVRAVVDAAQETHTRPCLAIISTVLPGTIRREILPITEGILPVVYSPQFISMGNVMQDYLNPEIFLIGVHDEMAAALLRGFYATIADAPQVCTTIENAEFIKVGYNVYIGVKIMFANLMGELAHRLDTVDIDTFTHAVSLSTRRLISTKYLKAGGGDGGQCHNRDAIALAWLAREVGLSFNLFDAIMQAREAHAEFLCDLLCAYDLPKVILGTAFKANTNIETGSAAILCLNILRSRGCSVDAYDPHVHGPGRMEGSTLAFGDHFTQQPHAYLIGTNHPEFVGFKFPKGSVVIDPWGIIKDQEGVKVIRVGRP